MTFPEDIARLTDEDLHRALLETDDDLLRGHLRDMLAAHITRKLRAYGRYTTWWMIREWAQHGELPLEHYCIRTGA